MQLLTAIKPRRDGTVIVAAPSGVKYVFKADAGGDLACDVVDASDVAWLLKTDNFYPARAEDHLEALSLTAPADGNAPIVDDYDDETGDELALPVEANTPPVKRTTKPQKK